jgi:hypothetical protein
MSSVIAKAITQSLNDSTLLLGIARHFQTAEARLNPRLPQVNGMAQACEITGIPVLAQHVNLAVSLTRVAKESASIFRIMCPRWI